MEQAQLDMRKDSLKGEHKCFILNEGVCPTCWHDTKITAIGGQHEFMMGWEHLENIERNWWAESPKWNGRVVGGMTFKCSNGHEHYVEQYVDGDWSS